ncbi:MAG: dihydroxy-acid dehydratase, partial [Janthinobacterium sp.]
VDMRLGDWDRLGRDIPCLLNLMPSGQYLMEDFYYAGGLPVIIRDLLGKLHGEALTVTGATMAVNVAEAENFNPEVITPLAQPFKDEGGIAVLHGNLS